MRPERTATAWISCASWVPTSNLVFPSIIRSICLCREIKKCAVWQCGKRENAGAVQHIEQEKYSLSSRQHLSYERLQRSFLVLEPIYVPVQEKHQLSFSNPCVCQISSTNTIHLLPNVSKVGLDDESLCDVFEMTAPPRYTPCTTLPSHGDAVSHLRPQVRHCTEPDQDLRKLSCLSVSFLAATATEKIIGFVVSHCEL